MALMGGRYTDAWHESIRDPSSDPKGVVAGLGTASTDGVLDERILLI